MQYLDGIKTNAPTEPDNALIVGQAVHTGIEKSLEEAIREYCFSYPIISDEHINETIKFETVIPLARAALPPGGAFEVEIKDKDFHGFIDYLVPVEMDLQGKDEICDSCKQCDSCSWSYSGRCPKGKFSVPSDSLFDLYDFKYSNNVSGYQKSAQLHLYKYFFERDNPGKKIRDMYFMFIPKISVRQRKTESLFDFRRRLAEELEKAELKTVQIRYDPEKVIEFLIRAKAANEETEFPQKESYLCRYCEFQEYCEKGWDYFMKLPENKRRSLEMVEKRVIWIYGAPFCGKTTFANNFPDPLMLNTDGNIKFVDSPFIRIKDEVRVEGRQTKRTLAWEVFKDTVAELEKKENTFKTIVVDLLEDLYEHCRLYMYQQMGITHESDDSFRAWDKVRGEFLNTLKKLMNLDYENIILISHEDTSRDFTRKGGDKISAIKPNIQDKIANKVAGMVDVVARIVADGGAHTFSFKNNEVIFGGGRLKVNAQDIPLDVDALFAVYDEANKNAASGMKPAVAEGSSRTRGRKAEQPTSPTDRPQDSPEPEGVGKYTPEPETPQNAPEMGTEENPTVATDDVTGVPENAPATMSLSDAPVADTTEAPAQDEKPRRRRKARD